MTDDDNERGFKMSGRTQFARWLDEMRWTRAKASEELQISMSQIDNLVTGCSRTTGKPVVPSRELRVLMRLYAEGRVHEVKPWPADEPRIAA